jgi:hypothetical protein
MRVGTRRPWTSSLACIRPAKLTCEVLGREVANSALGVCRPGLFLQPSDPTLATDGAQIPGLCSCSCPGFVPVSFSLSCIFFGMMYLEYLTLG